jgi:hypothetical protein
MNWRKKLSMAVVAVLVLAGTVAFGQGNTCAYTFTFPKHSFQFCLTGDGTLALLQSPLGVNHLDTANPIEGWSWQVMGTVPGGGDVFFDGQQVPAYGGSTLGTPTVTQPNGPGTLPIRFDWHGFPADMWETVSAQPAQRLVVLRVGIPAKGVWWGGSLTRLITLRLDGTTENKFRHLRVGAFAYVDGGEALVLQSPAPVCFGPGEIFDRVQCAATPFNGYGTLIAEGEYTPHTPTLVVTYQIF